MASLLARLGLHRRELRAWAMYDWANSAFVLLIITAVFPLYYQGYAAAGLDPQDATARFGWATSISLLVVALAAPALGALADLRAVRKKLLGLTAGAGIAATAALALPGEGRWLESLMLFGLGNIGLTLSFVFYDALLPHVARGGEIDRVSTGGYALGYLGSGLLLLLSLVLIQHPGLAGLSGPTAATRAVFVAVACWWALFSLPLFRSIPEPPPLAAAQDSSLGARLRQTVRELRGPYRDAARLLAAIMLYNEGIGTIIRMAAVYAAGIGLPRTDVILAILLVQFLGVPCAFLFGGLAGRIGTKPAILTGIAVYALICVLAYRMESSVEFFVLAGLVALVQGGTQALSRSLFASMIPAARSTEFFGFYSVFEKISGVLGPGLFGVIVWLTGSTRLAILTVLVFFVAGAGLLLRTDVARGRAAAQAGA